MAWHCVLDWISQQGAAYRQENVRDVYARICTLAQQQGFYEVPDRDTVEGAGTGGISGGCARAGRSYCDYVGCLLRAPPRSMLPRPCLAAKAGCRSPAPCQV